MPLPQAKTDIETAKADLRTYGPCVLTKVLNASEAPELRARLASQAQAERRLGELASKDMVGAMQFVPNMLNEYAQ